MKYTIDYFIKKFSKIPDSKWTTKRYKRGERCCAFGHCGQKDVFGTKESQALAKYQIDAQYFSGINDGDCEKFQQSKPKARVLAALKYLKDNGVK